MNRLLTVGIIMTYLSFVSHNLLSTSLGAPKDKEGGVSFTGTLISQENPDRPLNVINIGIGTHKDATKVKQIPMYEKPTKFTPPSAGINEIIIEVQPEKNLIKTFIDLNEVSQIEVPYPTTVWTYKEREKAPKIEYIELIITANNKEKTKKSYLLELGRQDTKAPTKVFCDSIDKEIPMTAIDKDKPESILFCTGIAKKDLRETGVPFRAIKTLTIEGYCHKPPENK